MNLKTKVALTEANEGEKKQGASRGTELSRTLRLNSVPRCLRQIRSSFPPVENQFRTLK